MFLEKSCMFTKIIHIIQHIIYIRIQIKNKNIKLLFEYASFSTKYTLILVSGKTRTHVCPRQI